MATYVHDYHTAEPFFKPPEVVIYDLDGTVTSVDPNIARLASVSDKYQLPLSKAFMWSLNVIQQSCQAFGIPCDNLKNDLMKRLVKQQYDVQLVLAAATSKKVSCVLLSNGPEEWGQPALEHLGYKHFFKKAVFREQMPKLKPDPSCLEIALDGYVAKKPDPAIWVYGDRSSDVMLAVNGRSSLKQNFVSVAIKGTEAASMIHQLADSGKIAESIVFQSPQEMAYHILQASMCSSTKNMRTPT